jgi:hypothetical protein
VTGTVPIAHACDAPAACSRIIHFPYPFRRNPSFAFLLEILYSQITWMIHKIVTQNTYLSENIKGAIEKSHGE